MIINTDEKFITITYIDELIYIKNNELIIGKKDKSRQYCHYNLGDINKFDNYTLFINVRHVLEFENDFEIVKEANHYNLNDLYDKQLLCIKCGCLYPNDGVIKLMSDLKLENINMAEIGIRYSITSEDILNKFNNTIKRYDLYDVVHVCCEHARNIFKYDNRINVFEGSADESFKKLDENIIYNFVYFDASHHYEIDIKILDELIKHIDKNTIICFDDYDVKDVNKLVNEFVDKKLCIVYTLTKNQINKF